MRLPFLSQAFAEKVSRVCNFLAGLILLTVFVAATLLVLLHRDESRKDLVVLYNTLHRMSPQAAIPKNDFPEFYFNAILSARPTKAEVHEAIGGFYDLYEGKGGWEPQAVSSEEYTFVVGLRLPLNFGTLNVQYDKDDRVVHYSMEDLNYEVILRSE